MDESSHVMPVSTEPLTKLTRRLGHDVVIGQVSRSDAASNEEASVATMSEKRRRESSLSHVSRVASWMGGRPGCRSSLVTVKFKKAEKIMPSSAILKNNLAYAYAKVHALDSASFYMSAARKSDLTKSSAEGNFFAMAATELSD